MSFLEWFETLITEWCTGAQCPTISMACIKQIPADDRVREKGSSPFFSKRRNNNAEIKPLPVTLRCALGYRSKKG